MRFGLFFVFAACVSCTGGTITGSPPDDAATSEDAPDLRVAPPDLTTSDDSPDLRAPGDLLTAAKTIGPFTLTFDLVAGAFPFKTGQPSALVYIPSGFDPTPPLDLVVYIHGFNNCVVNIVKETGAACTTGQGARGASNLINQLEDSHRNAIFIAPEVKFDQATGDPGKLGNADGFKNLLVELLPKLEPQLGAVDLDDVGDILLMSHSGGYWATAMMATKGGVPVREVHLLDSLYGYESTFKAWILQDPDAHATTPPQRRFFSIYTAGGGTDDNNIAMANDAKTWAGLDQTARVHDDTTATWTPDHYLHGAMWKRSGLSHSGVVLYYFQQILQTSPLLVDKP